MLKKLTFFYFRHLINFHSFDKPGEKILLPPLACWIQPRRTVPPPPPMPSAAAAAAPYNFEYLWGSKWLSAEAEKWIRLFQFCSNINHKFQLLHSLAKDESFSSAHFPHFDSREKRPTGRSSLHFFSIFTYFFCAIFYFFLILIKWCPEVWVRKLISFIRI